jgi:hypothetical protein
MFEIKPISGKGRGTFVTRNIPRGTQIMTDSPLVVVSSAVINSAALSQKAYEALSSADQAIVDSMKAHFRARACKACFGPMLFLWSLRKNREACSRTYVWQIIPVRQTRSTTGMKVGK